MNLKQIIEKVKEKNPVLVKIDHWGPKHKEFLSTSLVLSRVESEKFMLADPGLTIFFEDIQGRRGFIIFGDIQSTSFNDDPHDFELAAALFRDHFIGAKYLSDVADIETDWGFYA